MNGPTGAESPPGGLLTRHVVPPASPLPKGYALESSEDGSQLGVYELWRASIARTGFGPDRDGALSESELAGRGAMAELELEGRRLVVRRFRRGGAMRYLKLGYGNPWRPFEELALSDRLIREGLPTPRVAFARARPRPGKFGYDLDLGTDRIEQALDLGTWLERVRERRVGALERQRVIRAAGRLIARLHAAGLAHADLTPRNLMLEEPSREELEPRLWVIDLDKSVLRDRLTEAARTRNLRRLWRSVARREGRGAKFVCRTDCARFLRAHQEQLDLASQGPSGEALKSRTSWRGRWKRIASGQKRAQFLHGLGWTLERITGRGPAGRDGAAQVRSARDGS